MRTVCADTAVIVNEPSSSTVETMVSRPVAAPTADAIKLTRVCAIPASSTLA